MDTPAPASSTSLSISTKSLAHSAFEANKRLQQTLTARAEKLEAELLELDTLLAAATVEESQDEPESEVSIPGAKKAVGLFPASEFLNPASPFYREAERRSTYIANTNPHPLKPKDLEILASAVRKENERLSAYARILPTSSNFGENNPIDLDKNTEGLDWTRIAEKVSDASSVKRNATECQIAWIADKHPDVNHSEWSSDEIDKLNSLISECTREKKTINWVNIAEKLGTHRVPIDCMRHGIPRHRHTWSPETDEKLIQAVEACGVDNWQLVARTVSEHVSAGQCQNRWQKTLCPSMRKGTWTEEEDDRLRKSVAGYGVAWMQVATAIPGRTNDQCRERWTQHVNVAKGKIEWTDAEDQILLDSVKELGNMWKAISVKLGGNKTGQSCRMRYDKLMRNQKAAANKLGQANASSSAAPGPGAPNPAPTMIEFSIHNPDQPVGETSTAATRKKGKGKGKSKAPTPPEAAAEGSHPDIRTASQTPNPSGSGDASQEAQPGTAGEAAPIVPPKPRPKPRPRTTTKKAVAGDATVAVNPVDATEPPTDIPAAAAGSDNAEGSEPLPAREVPVISGAKRGRKRKLPPSTSPSVNVAGLVEQQQVDKPLPKKKAKAGAGTRRKGNAGGKRSEPGPSSSMASVGEDGDVMAVDEREDEAAEASAQENIQDETQPQSSTLDTPRAGNQALQEPSEAMDVDVPETAEQEQADNATPKPRRRGRPKKQESEVASTQTSPSTRRSARLRK